ncbi:hypothetical protein C6P45_004146 [Maudiozyma exigua]|uniref:Uncharacterized protein n=1 Tax=Maudiozyma exigua TaxID=34358 RepID=A0A9P7BAM3_MAUEX|nr:hypothetical protein C6P45_004146 [Kazachstania exigua]
MNEENVNPYEDYYLDQLDNSQINSKTTPVPNTVEQQQIEEMYYRSLQEHFPKLKPIDASTTFTYIRKRNMEEGNNTNNSTIQEIKNFNEQPSNKRKR